MTNAVDSTADYFADRRRLRRKLTFWRLAAFVALAAILIGGAWRFYGGGRPNALSRDIARVTIRGLITGDRDQIKMLDEVADSNAAAMILDIDSPGGTTTGAERLYDAIRRVEAKKPVVAVVGTMAASGAYIAAIGADRILARGNSLVGSIGVLFEFPNVSKLLSNVGVQMEAVKSSPLKAAPNGLEPTSPEARAALAALVADAYDWFKGLVRDRRAMNDGEIAAVSDGRVFSGRQAMPLKLIDALGGEREAVAWLEDDKGVAKGSRVRDWRPQNSGSGFGLLGFSAAAADVLGLTDVSKFMYKLEDLEQSRALDGLLAVWQGSSID